MNQELLVKQLVYRSLHRGCKETDFLLGNFAEEKLSQMEASDLKLFDRLLVEDDLKIYDWILGKELTPVEYQKLVSDIRRFHKI